MTSRPIRIATAGVMLNGDLSIPERAEGMIVFVHGSGSSRFSSRNRAVADMLVQVRLGTLLLDLLTEPEERKDAVTAEFRLDLDRVTAPTLLIVGGRDQPVIELNRQAFDRLSGRRDLQIVPGATHLFEEPGALIEVARLATRWFLDHLI